MKKLIILFAIALAITSCEKSEVQNANKKVEIRTSYDLDKSIFIFPTARFIGKDLIRLEASVSQTEIGSDVIRSLKLDKLYFYIKNIKTGIEKTLTSTNTYIDINDLAKNNEYLITIEGFVNDRKSQISNEIFITTYPNPKEKVINQGFNFFENQVGQGNYISENLEKGIIFNRPLDQLKPSSYNLIDFKTKIIEKIIEFSLMDSKTYQFIGWSADEKKAFFKIIENNTIGIVYYDIDKKTFVNLPFSTTRKINQIQISSDNQKMAFKVETDVFVYDFENKTEIKLPVLMEGFQWIKNQNALAYTHIVSNVSGNKKYYLLSEIDIEKMESKPLIKRAIIPNLGDFKISPDYKKVVFGSNLAGGFNAWHYDTANEKLTMIPSESGVGQFKWLNNDEFVIIGYRGINSYRF